MEKFYVPIAIVLGGLLITSAIMFTTEQKRSLALGGNTTDTVERVTNERQIPVVNPRREEHRNIKGDEDAAVTIVEFSDFECPFCARVHPTLEAIVEEFDGDVNWEYRHLPLVSHPNARDAAIAAECVADLAGNEAFWDFTTFLFANQRRLSEDLYLDGATNLGVAQTAFERCLSDEAVAARVLEDERTALTLGGGGTPFSVVVYEDGTIRTAPGALPYNQFKALVTR